MTDLPIPQKHRRFRIDDEGVAWFAEDRIGNLPWVRVSKLKPGSFEREDCGCVAEVAFLREAERIATTIQQAIIEVDPKALGAAINKARTWRTWGEEERE